MSIGKLLERISKDDAPGVLDMKNVYLENIQRACATLIDDPTMSHRTTERIGLVQRLIIGKHI